MEKGNQEDIMTSITYAGEIFKEISRESDRASAILTGAELEGSLFRIIDRYLLPEIPSKGIRLLGKDGPLGSLASRIETVYRLGLIPPSYHHDLHLLRRIRNEFAHGPKGISFENQRIAAWCGNLKLLDEKMADFLGTIDRMKIAGITFGTNSPKDQFIEVALVMLTVLVAVEHHVVRVKDTWKGTMTDWS